ncbi:MAG: glycosyltransferase family 4 protein [Paludibacteraceae bacterium]|nr:glycosyltransferase family 4 protein [Paludibacteraceae bacterium]
MIDVIMHGSTLDTKGGMVSVVKNYLGNTDWGDYRVTYVPTHFDTNPLVLMIFFCIQFLKIIVLIKTKSFKIAHLHTAERGSFWRKRFLLKFYHRHGIKVIMHHHAGGFESFYSHSSKYYKNIIKRTLLEVDVNIALGNSMRDVLKSIQPDANIFVLHNAVKIYTHNMYSLSSKNVVMFGRLVKNKGVFDLLEAIRRLDGEIPKEIRFCLCGDRGEKDVEKEVERLGIEHRIGCIGWVDNEKKESIISNAMIHCLLSYYEGLPMSILETMSMGIPNIATSISSIPDVIRNGENGFLITPGDIGALCVCIKRLVSDESLRLKFSKMSYEEIIQGFSIKSHMERLMLIYNELI